MGSAIAEREESLDRSPSLASGIIAVGKIETKILELPDANWRAKKMWTTNYKYRREVQIFRPIKLGLFYEVDE